MVFAENGAFNINEQWATGVGYETRQAEDKVTSGEIKFVNGRQQIARATFLTREEAVDLLGEQNVKNIEAGLGKDEKSPADMSKGMLKGKDLAFREAYTPGMAPENSIEPDAERDQQASPALVQPVVKDQGKPEQVNDTGKSGTVNPEDRSKAVPDHIVKRFVQVRNKYYFPDKTLAFVDHGGKLGSRSENKEVVKSLLDIAQHRGWENITVNGSEEFRRAVWHEAGLRGMNVKGYKPTDVELAHMAKAMQAQDPSRGDGGLPNTVEQGRARDASNGNRPEPSHDNGNRKGGVMVGKLLDHGAAPYDNKPANPANYYAKLDTGNGERKILWGLDLQRAIKDGGVKAGDDVAVEYRGRKAVIVKVKERDKEGNIIGEKEVSRHRNVWSVEKAEAFRRRDRGEVVKEYPELAGAYGTLAAARKFAEREWPDSKEDQDRFVSVTKEVLAGKIEHREKVPAPKIHTTQNIEQPAQAAQNKKDRDKQQEVER